MDSWIQDSINKGLDKIDSPFEKQRRIINNSVAMLVKNGLKELNEIKVAVYCQLKNDPDVMKNIELYFHWIDEDFKEYNGGLDARR